MPTKSARRTLVIAFSTAVTAAVATGGCGSGEAEIGGPIEDESYVAVMSELADLERFPPPGPDEATRTERADSARQAILDRHGVTADELLEFAEAAGARPDVMVELANRIIELSDSLAHRRTGAGAAADSAAAREPATDAASDTATEAASDTVSVPAPSADTADAADAADSTPPGGLDHRSFRDRARQLRERADAEPEQSP